MLRRLRTQLPRLSGQRSLLASGHICDTHTRSSTSFSGIGDTDANTDERPVSSITPWVRRYARGSKVHAYPLMLRQFWSMVGHGADLKNLILCSVISGADLCRNPKYNKGLAFTETERDRLYLRGLLPPAILSQDVQVNAAITTSLLAACTGLAGHVFCQKQ